MAATNEPPSIAVYFKAQLGKPLLTRHHGKSYDPDHPAFHIHTTCGADCRKAIDAARDLLEHSRKANGEREQVTDTIIALTIEIVMTYVYG